MRVGFIGAGRVGYSLGQYFYTSKITLSGFYSRHFNEAKQASLLTGSHAYPSLAQLVEDSDIIFITVPDNQIATVWQSVASLPIDNKVLGHCSGLHSSGLLNGIEQLGACGFSLHPLYAINDKYESYHSLSQCYFTVEGGECAIKSLSGLLTQLGNRYAIIQADKKPLYHAACVILSNQVIALTKLGSDLLHQCGLNGEFSEKAWHSLFLGNAHTLCQKGMIEALTGPVERNDIETIAQHLTHLNPQTKQIYLDLSKILLELSKQKHPQRDYHQLELELMS